MIPQISNYEEAIIYISDNCSSEDYSYAENLTKKYSFIIYSKNSANIGGNANIANAFCCPIKSRYLWILSDSEVPTETCIEELNSFFNSNSQLCLFSQINESASCIHSYHDDHDWLFQNGIGQISNLVFDRNHFSSFAEAAYFYHNSSFPHLAVFFSLIKEKKSCNMYFLNVAKMLNLTPKFSDSDYRLACIGMPLISELFPPKYAIKFNNSWLSTRWYYYFKNKYFLPHLFYASKAILLRSKNPLIRLKFLVLASTFKMLQITGINEDRLKRFKSKSVL